MTHTRFNFTGTSLTLCPDHRADAMMWLWQEFEGTWTATVTGHPHCDVCAHDVSTQAGHAAGARVPAAFQAAVARQQDASVQGPSSTPGRAIPIFRDAPRTLSAIS